MRISRNKKKNNKIKMIMENNIDLITIRNNKRIKADKIIVDNHIFIYTVFKTINN